MKVLIILHKPSNAKFRSFESEHESNRIFPDFEDYEVLGEAANKDSEDEELRFETK